MPSITLLAPNYFPETNAGAKRVTRLAEHLARAGWHVHVITLLPHHPQNRVYDGYEDLAGSPSTEKGVHVTRLRPWLVSKNSLALRLVAETWACLKMTACALRAPHKSDVYFASSPFMFLGPSGILISRLTRRPFVWDVRDLTWLYPRAAGKRTFGLDRPLERMMRWVARSSAALTTATEGLFDYFEQRPALALLAPNGVNEEVLDAFASQVENRSEPAGRPLVVYIGLFGYNHGLSTVLAAARLLPSADFLFVGDGPDRGELEQAQRELPNVQVKGYLPFEDLIAIYNSATVLVSHVRKNPIFQWTQPAKLWEYMASVRPVVHAGEGEVIRILERERIALTVPPEDPQALADAIEKVVIDPKLASGMALRGRSYVEVNRNTEVIFTEMEALLKKVLATREAT